MTGRIATLALLAALSWGCGRGVESREVTTPSGRVGIAIRCKRAIDCLETAGRTCPGGYDTVDRASETEGGGFGSSNQGSGFAVARVETTGTMLIECRGPSAAELERRGANDRDRKSRRCGYTCGPQPRECPFLDDDGCYKPGYKVPE